MMRAVNVGMVGFGFLAALCHAAGSGAPAKEWITFKNGMNAPITVLVKASQQAAPAQYRILRGDMYKYPIEHVGPHTIQVIPDDQKDSGYHMGSHDLRVLGRALASQPLELRGEFQQYIEKGTDRIVEDRNDRVRAYFDVPAAVPGLAIRHTSARIEYMRAMLEEEPNRKEEPAPKGTQAVITLIVPRNARVTIAGERTVATGTCRYFTSPPLVPGKKYSYEVKVAWNNGEHVCRETRWVPVRASEVTRSYFILPIVPPPAPIKE